MDNDKRSLLGALGVGTGAALLPSKWVSPVIDSVILPAHAITSLTFAITACTGESRNGAPTGQLFQTGAEAIENITATVTPIPPEGTVIRLIPTVTPVELNYGQQTEPTDATGIADGFIPLGLPNAEPVAIGSVFTLRFEFDDQSTFGNSFCEVQLTVVQTPP